MYSTNCLHGTCNFTCGVYIIFNTGINVNAENFGDYLGRLSVVITSRRGEGSDNRVLGTWIVSRFVLFGRLCKSS